MHGFADGVGAGGTCGHNAEIRTARANLDGKHTRADVADQRWNGERRNLAGAALHELPQLQLVGHHAADAGADEHANPVGIFLRHVEARVRKRLLGGAKSEMRVTVIATSLLGIHVLLDIPAANLRADLGGVGRWIKQGDAVDAAFAGQKAGPEGIGGLAETVDGAKTGDDDALGIRKGFHGSKKRGV